jgi:hypothetical protein
LTDKRDHLDWLVDRTLYEDAFDLVEKEFCGDRKLFVSIGQKYIQYLFDKGIANIYDRMLFHRS